VVGAREVYDELPSTQDRAIALAREGAADGTRVVARRQRVGRGRSGHSWASPPGGLYLSIVTRTPPVGLPLLPLAVGVELADGLDARWSIRARLKWPNDLFVERPGVGVGKLAGVLVDSVADPEGQPVQVVGVGVNVRRPPGGFRGPMAVPPVTLEDLVRPAPTPEELEPLVAAAVAAAPAALASPERVAATVGRCRARLFGVGRRARSDGGARGTIARLADDGALVLDVGGTPVALLSGEVSVEVT